MTVVTAERIVTADQAVRIATELAEAFAAGAAERDLSRRLPHEELDQLSASGLLAITVPAEFGGADLPPSVVAEVVRILAAADPNIAQVPHSHFVYLNLLRLAGTRAQRRDYFGKVLAGARIANAQSERSGATVAEIATVLRPIDGAAGRGGARRFVVEGTKFYCTGSLFADVLAVLTRLDDPQDISRLAPGEYVAFVPALEPGVRIVDDWDALGQRTTGSGTVEFDAVEVGHEQLVARFGELAVAVAAAESTLIAAGAAVDAAVRPGVIAEGEGPVAHLDSAGARASIAVATAKILADRAANEVSAAIFEVGGTRSAASEHRLDHFWRNARTHTLHDPVRWKYQHIGRAVLHNRPPPLHGVI